MYELLNQLGDNNHYTIVSTLIASNGMTVGTTRVKFKYTPHSSLGHNPATNTQYLLDDTLYFRVSVKVGNIKPWLVCTDCNTKRATDNCTEVILRIAEYNKHKTMNMQTKSNSFYTSIEGNVMWLRIDANGVCDGKAHMYLFSHNYW